VVGKGGAQLLNNTTMHEWRLVRGKKQNATRSHRLANNRDKKRDEGSGHREKEKRGIKTQTRLQGEGSGATGESWKHAW